MNTLFLKHKSIIGNTRAQISTDREGFVHVHYMQSKSQDGKYLNEVTRYIGVPNTLISDNAGEQTGPRKELQKCIHHFCNDGSTS